MRKPLSEIENDMLDKGVKYARDSKTMGKINENAKQSIGREMKKKTMIGGKRDSTEERNLRGS